MKSHFIFLMFISQLVAQVDIIIFSFDRPLQLYTLLESMHKYIKGHNQITVLYRASNDSFEKAYTVAKEKFGNVIFEKHKGKEDFKENTTNIIKQSNAQYTCFAVDDIIITDLCDLDICVEALNLTNAYAFYLRLGKNITHCYTMDIEKNYKFGIYTGTPLFIPITSNIFSFHFGQVKGEWDYPNTLDMTIYRKETVLNFIEDHHIWYSPNTFEGTWANIQPHTHYGLCFEFSKIINIPLNLVNLDCKNRITNKTYDKHSLLDLFNNNYKIDITPLTQFLPPAPHYDYEVTFIKRN